MKKSRIILLHFSLFLNVRLPQTLKFNFGSYIREDIEAQSCFRMFSRRTPAVTSSQEKRKWLDRAHTGNSEVLRESKRLVVCWLQQCAQKGSVALIRFSNNAKT